MIENLKRGERYPLAVEDRAKAPTGAMAVWSGERRPPQRGEWFLSGSIIEAYRAPNDLTTVYHIATVVVPETTVTAWKTWSDRS